MFLKYGFQIQLRRKFKLLRELEKYANGILSDGEMRSFYFTLEKNNIADIVEFKKSGFCVLGKNWKLKNIQYCFN